MSRTSSGLYEFGPFSLNLERRVLMREHQVLPLAPKTFDLLVLLVQSPGPPLSKKELMNALWPDTFVEEANLSYQISALRKALGEDGAGQRSTLVQLDKRFWFGMTLSPDEGSLVFPLVDSAGSNLMLVDKFR